MDTALNWSPVIQITEETAAEVLDPDVHLMLRVKGGDMGAFGILFEKHTRALINFTFRFVRNRDTAEELAQEIFLKVYENAAGYQAQARFSTWLYRIATNICLNEIRKPRFRATHQSLNPRRSDSADSAPADIKDEQMKGPDKLFEQRTIAQILKQALERLPEKQRIAFVLNKYQEFSYAEVADIMRISEKAVKSLIHRAKGALAERLNPLMPELLLK